MGGSSLARSEGNLSGIALLFDEVANKWLELLVETVPVAQRIGVLFDPSPSDALQLRAIGATAEKLGKPLLPLRIDNVDMIRNALERARSEKLDGLVFLFHRRSSPPMQHGSSSSCNQSRYRRSTRRACWRREAG